MKEQSSTQEQDQDRSVSGGVDHGQQLSDIAVSQNREVHFLIIWRWGSYI